MKKFLLFLLPLLALAACSPRLSPDATWGSQRWVLIEMKEVPVQQSGGSRDAYVEFITSEKRFTGNGGCNRISGNYILEKRSRIRFTDVISTKMSCPDIAFENTFLATLAEVNHFEVDGSNMLLKNDNKVLLILQRR